jgi:hypothetical protein
MESTSARDIDRRLADLVRHERHLVVKFVVELAGFAKRELYRELGYTSLFYYCVRQLGLSKSSAFRRSEVARLIGWFPAIADRLEAGKLSIRALVELREVLTDENHAEVLARAPCQPRLSRQNTMRPGPARGTDDPGPPAAVVGSRNRRSPAAVVGSRSRRPRSPAAIVGSKRQATNLLPQPAGR